MTNNAEPEIVERSEVQTPRSPVVVALAHGPGTKRWYVLAAPLEPSPLVLSPMNIALQVQKVRYDEPRARALFARVLRAVEMADIGQLRKACRPWERNDEFFCWAFGLTSLQDALVMRETNEALMGLGRARDRGEITQEEFWRQYHETEQAIRLRRMLSGPLGDGGAPS